jgi:acyl carrier protein
MYTIEQVEKTILDEIKKISPKAKNLDDNVIKESEFDALNLDSLDILDMIIYLEKQFKTEIPDDFLDSPDKSINTFIQIIWETVKNTTVE